MVTRFITAYLCLQSLVRCGSTFNMTKIEITEVYGNVSNSSNMDGP